jgi:outer membrane protein TolC
VDLSQQIDTLLFGKRSAAIESAKRAVDVAEADFAYQKRRRTAVYKDGGRTILELLDAERAYGDAMRLHLHAQSSYWRALYQLDTAAGEPVTK